MGDGCGGWSIVTDPGTQFFPAQLCQAVDALSQVDWRATHVSYETRLGNILRLLAVFIISPYGSP